jgi:hypothetical protein
MAGTRYATVLTTLKNYQRLFQVILVYARACGYRLSGPPVAPCSAGIMPTCACIRGPEFGPRLRHNERGEAWRIKSSGADPMQNINGLWPGTARGHRTSRRGKVRVKNRRSLGRLRGLRNVTTPGSSILIGSPIGLGSAFTDQSLFFF